MLNTNLQYQSVNGIETWEFPGDSPYFHWIFQFPFQTYSFPKEHASTIQTAVESYFHGGIGPYTYGQWSQELYKTGLKVSLSLNDNENLELSIKGLKKDIPLGIKILGYVLNSVDKIKAADLDLWKRKNLQNYKLFMNMDEVSSQISLVKWHLDQLTYGEESYWSDKFKGTFPSEVSKVSLENVISLRKRFFSRVGVKFFSEGLLSTENKKELIKILNDLLPKNYPLIWMPKKNKETEYDALILHHPAMKDQTIVGLQYTFPVQHLNILQKKLFQIALEVFSSSAGAVGDSRFSKAMRKDSGLSYFAQARCHLGANENQKVLCRLYFQSPTSESPRAIGLAQDAWNTWVDKGITEEEMENAIRTLTHSYFSWEKTLWEKIAPFIDFAQRNRVLGSTYAGDDISFWDSLKDPKEINTNLKELADDSLPTAVLVGNISESSFEKTFKKIKTLDIQSIETEILGDNP